MLAQARPPMINHFTIWRGSQTSHRERKGLAMVQLVLSWRNLSNLCCSWILPVLPWNGKYIYRYYNFMMDGCVDGWIDGWTSEQIDKMDGRTDGQITAWTGGRTDIYWGMDGWMNALLWTPTEERPGKRARPGPPAIRRIWTMNYQASC